MEIKRLDAGHRRRAFRSGDPELDDFLQRFALQNQEKLRLSTTWIVAREDEILGFVTLALGSVERATIPLGRARRLANYPVPVLLIARLAVDHRERAHGIGKRLIHHAMRHALKLQDDYGLFAIVVDAKPGALSFYERLGFEPFEGDETWPRRLFLTVADIRKAME